MIDLYNVPLRIEAYVNAVVPAGTPLTAQYAADHWNELHLEDIAAVDQCGKMERIDLPGPRPIDNTGDLVELLLLRWKHGTASQQQPSAAEIAASIVEILGREGR